jgi:hypothetical protein
LRCGALGELSGKAEGPGGTQRAYFFTREKLVQLFEEAGFETLQIKVRDYCRRGLHATARAAAAPLLQLRRKLRLLSAARVCAVGMKCRITMWR